MKLNKIQDIINIFSEKDNFIFWKMGTKIASIMDNFYLYYSKLPDKYKSTNIQIENQNEKFLLKCVDQNITPSSSRNEPVSKSAIRQYIDVLCSFNIIVESNIKFNYIVLNRSTLKYDYEFIPSDIFLDLLKNFENYQYPQVKKIFYSALVSFLATFLNDMDFLFINTSKKQKEYISCKEIKRQSKKTGYDYFLDCFKFYGNNLDDIHENIIRKFA
ncbi:hypothetical protein SHELI_v1c03580 [Spiroplasma helicoides]|uniref:Uncharacterized protein n=1 Tax=Spiroplasma helicoides TaxID=216938 RepID=A0A1B3SK58_9MOLU|nr:hypothetical protein [Spiroplasma helicoides]AOG60313.1 hypothetical protein SHELI_v1c03580 [Spiroplasma helicoides]